MKLFEHPLTYIELAAFSAFTIHQIVGLEDQERYHALTLFLTRIYSTTHIKPTVVVLGLKYMERYVRFYRRQQLMSQQSSQTEAAVSSGLFVTALILANHYLDDHAYSNKTWAQVVQVDTSVIRSAQRLFLQCIDYNLNVSAGSFSQWVQRLQQLRLHMTQRSQPQYPTVMTTRAYQQVAAVKESFEVKPTVSVPIGQLLKTTESKRKRAPTIGDSNLGHSLRLWTHFQ